MPVLLFIPLLFLSVGSGGSNELLHFLQTDYYWKSRKMQPSTELLMAYIQPPLQAKDISALIEQLGHEEFAQRQAASHAIAAQGPTVVEQLKSALQSKDPEIADRSKKLIALLTGAGGDPLVHKLMVIRTLGEKKVKEAVAPLKTLTESREPFIADYARRALAMIEGKPAPDLGVPTETMEKDLWLLPAGCKLVGQQRLAGGRVFDWDAWFTQWGPLIAMIGQQKQKEELLGTFQKQVLEWLNAFGNLRVDGITVGVSDSDLVRDGHALFLLRGQYDRQRVAAFLKGKGKAIHPLEGLDLWHLENQAGMVMVSDQQLILLTASDEKQLPMKELAAALRTGKGTLADDVAMKALIASVDRTGEGWAVAQISDKFRGGYDVLQSFDTIKATRRRDQDRILLRVTLAGADEAKVKGAIGMLETGWKQSLESLKNGIIWPKPVLDFANSVAFSSKGRQGTIEAEMSALDDSFPGAIVAALLFAQSIGR